MGRNTIPSNPLAPSVSNWRRLLADEHERLNFPDLFYRQLEAMADALLASGEVEAPEHQNMIHLAAAGREHAKDCEVEAYQVYRRTGTYQLINDAGLSPGTLANGRYVPNEPVVENDLTTYGVVELTAQGLRVVCRTHNQVQASIIDLQLITARGTRYVLHPLSVYLDGVEHPVVTDPDVFGALLDALAADEHLSAKRKEKVRERLELSIFRVCWRCRNSLGKEDCPACEGIGFMPKVGSDGLLLKSTKQEIDDVWQVQPVPQAPPL